MRVRLWHRCWSEYWPESQARMMLEWGLYVDHTTIYRWVQLYASELEKRCLQSIDDLIGGIMRLMWVKHNRLVNLGNPEENSGLTLAAYLVKEITESLSLIVFKPLLQIILQQGRPDISRAKEHLHWGPKVPIREGLMWTVGYCRETLRPPSRGGV
jgi:UDP-glucuronate decarboxylase